jgi:predicted dehydrogenase
MCTSIASANHDLYIAGADAYPRPIRPRPIVTVGAGGIVRDAHLPAYKKAGFPVIGIMDTDREKAAKLAKQWHIGASFGSLDELVKYSPRDAVFDIAAPASKLKNILRKLPNEATVLMQKPMGETLEEARIIREICRQKGFIAAVNFSQRYSPNNLAMRSLHDAGKLGEVHDFQVQVRVFTPWHLWKFLSTAPRLEILYHSIHYFDLIRSWLGNPDSVYARTVKDPAYKELAATKTVAILDYGEDKRVFVSTHHGHDFGLHHQESYIQIEGTEGAGRMKMGVLLGYPTGQPDSVQYSRRGTSAWIDVPITGNNFPDGFMGTMGALQAFAEGSATTLPCHYEDGYQTMALVEALYHSSMSTGEPLELNGFRRRRPRKE